MDDVPEPPKNSAPMVAAFEGGLALLAVGLGWLLKLDPLEAFHWDMKAIGLGVIATLPLLPLFWMCVKVPFRPFQRILQILDELILPLIQQCNVLELAIISTLAGLGEEMLFRGIVQAGIAGWISLPGGPWIALAAAAILFGFVHAVTLTYAILACVIGFYLGGLWLATASVFGELNLLVPITTHAVYDFVALVYLIKRRKSEGPVSSENGVW